jgi:undecaprenyl-diphosphatase
MLHSLILFCAEYLVALAPLVVAWVLWRVAKSSRRVLLLRGVVVLVLLLLFDRVAGALYYEPRPFVVQHTAPLIPHAPDNGFPSEHTMLAFACAFLVLPFSLPAALVTAAMATAVGLGRVASSVHSPLDITAGLLFAALANALAMAIVRPHSEMPINTPTAS